MTLNFIHITDLHLSHPDLDDPNLHSDTVANLAAMVGRLRAISPAPAFVVVSGDLTNRGDVASYQLVRDMLADVGMPVVYALGNHDNRAAFRSVFSEIARESGAHPDAPYCHQSTHHGLQIITLDSSYPGRVGGRICRDQFDFLERTLRTSGDRRTLLIIHHPPLIGDTSLPWESLDRPDTDRLAAALQGHHVVGLLSGHVHFNRVSQWHGIPVIVSNGLHATVDVLLPAGMKILQGTGFAACALRPSGLTVSFVPLTPERPVLGEIPDDVLKSFR